MDNRLSYRIAFSLGFMVSLADPISLTGQAVHVSNILKASEAEQTSWIQSTLEEGIPPDRGDQLSILVLNKSSLTLPLIEKKIEDVLRAASPLELFSKKDVDPNAFVELAALTIAYAGDGQALRETSKLIKIDNQRFAGLVDRTLSNAEDFRNPFRVAYSGLEIGDPVVNTRIVAWVEAQLAAKTEFRIGQVRRLWAEAIVDRYNGVPVEEQWAKDPIVAHLRRSEADSRVLRAEMLRYAVEAFQRRQK